MRWSCRTGLVTAIALLAGCAGMYYTALEKVGIEKREILVDRLEATRDAQRDAQGQFKDALSQLEALAGYDGGALEERYNALSDEYEDCRAKAQAVRDRVAGVKDVAGALFHEWEGELGEYSDPGLKRRSRRQLDETRVRFAKLAAAMDRATASMDPVLATLHDQVLFLKHNLNARAVGSLSGTVGQVQADVRRLTERMQSAIAETDRFLASIRGS